MGQYVTKSYRFFGGYFTGWRFRPIGLKSEAQLQKERAYAAKLDGEEAKLDERIKKNECPKGQLADYAIKGYLSKGTYGQVFKVLQTELREYYALKVLKKKHLEKDWVIEALFFEKTLGFAAECEFIVKLVAAFQDNYNLYMVMDFAYYGDFGKIMELMPPQKTVKFYIAQVVLGIEYLHACHIVHRDLKPTNVFIFGDLYVKIGDLGLAVKVKERCYQSIGSPIYMAPEMEVGDGFGRGVDWWALGIVLYQLIYLEHPFCMSCKTREDVYKAVRTAPLIFPERRDDDFESVNNLIRGLLERDSNQRLGVLIGGAVRVKQQDWFKDISFIDVLEKKIRPNIDIEPVRPVKSATYPFIDDKTGKFDNSVFAGF